MKKALGEMSDEMEMEGLKRSVEGLKMGRGQGMEREHVGGARSEGLQKAIESLKMLLKEPGK